VKDLTIARSFHDRRIGIVWRKLFADPCLKVSKLSNVVGLSESRLQHLFVTSVGMTISEVKRQLRMARLHVAHCQLLESSIYWQMCL
jgi:AraC-like DNA-binding protein